MVTDAALLQRVNSDALREAPMKLLVAEHHRPTLEHLTGMLAQAGHSVCGVTEPGAALEHFVAENPDTVIMAVDFPRLDGAHLGQLLRASEWGARVPLLAIDKGHLGESVHDSETLLRLSRAGREHYEWIEKARAVLQAAPSERAAFDPALLEELAKRGLLGEGLEAP